MKPTASLAALATLFLGASAVAGPPLETDDPDTPGPNNWEINVSSMLETRRDSWEFIPLVDVNYGVGGRIQLKLKPRAVVLDDPRGARAGAGNLQLGVKWRFLDQASHGVSMSVYPQADFNPPGHSVKRGLVDDGHEFILPVQVLRAVGHTRVYAEAGYNWRENQTDEWVLGFAAEHPLSQKFLLAGELRDKTERDFADHKLFFNAGFKWSFSTHVTLLASAGRTLLELRGEGAAVFSYLGIQFTF
ncbi:MAG: transporter [Gammaproteobacteria bacterium]